MDVQVPPEHYDFETYDDLERWCSYWYQIRTALRLRPRTVLEIGSGTGVFGSYLRNRGIEVASADIDATRGPDYVADVSRLDETLPPGTTFDLVAAFQVLEHLPFDRLDACLAGIARRAAPWALISLPYYGVQARISFAIGDLKISLGRKIMKPWRKKFDGEHYWELGFAHSPRAITRRMRRWFDVERRFVIPENPYHVMWVLRSRETAQYRGILGSTRSDQASIPPASEATSGKPALSRIAAALRLRTP